MIKGINVQFIDHPAQRYPTVGDWWFDDKGVLQIRVSRLGDWRHEMLVTEHELREAVLCEQAGVTQQDVDKFDMEYEKNRTEGDTSEPGDHPAAPYRKQHFLATNAERVFAAELGVNWQEYESEIDSL